MELWVNICYGHHYCLFIYLFIPPESERHASYVEGISFNIAVFRKNYAQVVSVSKGNFSGTANQSLENSEYSKVSPPQLAFLLKNDLIKEVLERLEDL